MSDPTPTEHVYWRAVEHIAVVEAERDRLAAAIDLHKRQRTEGAVRGFVPDGVDQHLWATREAVARDE